MSDADFAELTTQQVAELNARQVGKQGKQRMQRSRTAFTKVPVPWGFIAARRLKNPALATLLAVLYAMRFGDRSVSLSERSVRQFRIDRNGLRRGLAALEKAGLARVVRNGLKAPSITLLNVSWPILPEGMTERLSELGEKQRFWWPAELLSELGTSEGWPETSRQLVALLRAVRAEIVTLRQGRCAIDLGRFE